MFRRCEGCAADISRQNWTRHLRSQSHLGLASSAGVESRGKSPQFDPRGPFHRRNTPRSASDSSRRSIQTPAIPPSSYHRETSSFTSRSPPRRLRPPT